MSKTWFKFGLLYLEIWKSGLCGTAEKFLTDNGSEFANDQFVQIFQSFGIKIIKIKIKIKTTATKTPWSNDSVKRHSKILSDMFDKILDATSCDLQLAVFWCASAKNSLINIHGFSPYQLTIETNPKLSSKSSRKSASSHHIPTNKIVAKNLKAIHKARETFIANENSEKKVIRALSHNVRSTRDIKYMTGESAYFKQENNTEWHGWPSDSLRTREKSGSS